MAACWCWTLAIIAGYYWQRFEYSNYEKTLFLTQAKGEVMRVRMPSSQTEGWLLQVVGPLQLENDSLYDPELMLNIQAAIVRRGVEMFQWQKKSSGDKYDSVWSPLSISSSNYSHYHQNPIWDSRLRSKVMLNENSATVRGFKIPHSLLNELSLGDLVPVRTLKLQKFSEVLGLVLYLDDTYIYLTPRERQHDKTFNPEIGDYRVYYHSVSNNAQVSVIGQQLGDQLKLWKGKMLLLSDTILDSDLLIDSLADSDEKQDLFIWRCIFSVLILLALLGSCATGTKKNIRSGHTGVTTRSMSRKVLEFD
jgi:hypothetical protein